MVKVTYNWLKDFVDIKIPAPELADKLTMAGLEVVSLQEQAGDFIFEIEITSNRPDWLSVYGIAREVAAITNAKLKQPYGARTEKIKKGSGLEIEIEDKNDCPLYAARIIKDVKVAPSCEWLSKRLELVGCRSVNNIVDITNYLLFELGAPLHAFDLDKLHAEKIIVRRAKPGEKITTLDGQERNLSNNVLVIADKVKAVAIAGVMGGRDTEVTFNTKNVLIEAAVFNPIIVRRGRQEQGLQREASYRFERGVDLDLSQKSGFRAAGLIQEHCAGKEACFMADGLAKAKEKKINLSVANTAKVLGVNIPAAKIKQILSLLGFKMQLKAKDMFRVTVPSFRQDVRLEVDLIEEASRIFGYGRIPASLPAVKPEVTLRGKRDLVSELKNVLVGLGLNEVITYSLTDREGLNSLGLDSSVRPIEIMNPLSQEQEVLRPTLAFSLGGVVSLNLNQKQDYVAIFEIANIFLGRETPQEELSLGIALSGRQSLLFEQGAVKDEASLLHLKGIIERVFSRFGIRVYEFIQQSSGGVDIYLGKEKIGNMSGLGPRALNKLGIKNKEVFVLEVSLDKILTSVSLDKKFVPLARYPGISRDISLILKDGLALKEVFALLKEKGQPLLRDLQITDYYKGKQIPAGYRGLTVSCLYGSSERTLTEEEIQPVHDAICAGLVQEFGVKIR